MGALSIGADARKIKTMGTTPGATGDFPHDNNSVDCLMICLLANGTKLFDLFPTIDQQPTVTDSIATRSRLGLYKLLNVVTVDENWRPSRGNLPFLPINNPFGLKIPPSIWRHTAASNPELWSRH